jgi:nucleotide-binding universal stress UspA family protein
VLTAKAGRWGADLLVVGSRGRSSLGRLLLGSVSRDVVSGARCSVRIVRKGRALGGSAVKVVVGTDGSSGAADAVRAVAARVWPAGSEIRLVTAVRSARADDAEARLSRVQGAHRADLERLLRAGLEVSHVVRTGDAKVAIVKEAKSWKADCIFVGSRGLGDSLTRYLLGSVSAALAREAPCTVEVVRPRVEMA